MKEQSPWPAGYNPKHVTLNSGDIFEMALGVGQPPSMPGRFATTSGNITDVNYVRTNLAVKGEWKPEIDRAVGYRVKDGITLPSLQGPVGPQIDLPLDAYLPGGAKQINIILDRSANAMDYFDITSISKIK